jgi:glycosyltransferase involved in cell wall biosynthesis
VKKISVITPCFNEEMNIEECQKQLREVFEKHLSRYEFEHIFADNASTDGTREVLRRIASKDNRVKVIVNSRNVGPFRNIWNAMKSATGDAVVPMLAADLQDPPEYIIDFVRHWEAGSYLTFGVRASREESKAMTLFRSIYYTIIQKFSNYPVTPNSGEYLLADRKVVDSLLELNDHYPYIRGMFAKCGVPSSFVEYTWVRRKNGKSKNNWVSLLDQAINGFVSSSRIPARLALLLGFVTAILGIVFAFFTIIASLLSEASTPTGIPTTIVGIFLLGGIQLFFLGLIGEYVLSIHGQVRPSPPMFEIERINFLD